MASVLFRTGSGSGSISSSMFTGSPLEAKNYRRIIRAVSAPKTISRLVSTNAGSQTFPEMLPEEDVVENGCIGSMKFAEKCFDWMSVVPDYGIEFDEARFTGFGNGSGRDHDDFGSGGSNNDDDDRKKIGAHYRKLLELNPSDPLLLRNYGKFLHEVEGDTVKAEQYYGRAILASPGDGELLSLYGKLIWDAQRDGERAQYYFDQAISVSPNDCVVMGSYAQFMWEAEEDESIEEEFESKVSSPAAHAI